jgi:hypothetical protein
MLFGICHTPTDVWTPGNMVWQNILNSLRTSSVILLFGKFGITTNLESIYSNNVGWQIRIWFRISTDIIVYAKQVLVTDQDLGGSVLHMSSFLIH